MTDTQLPFGVAEHFAQPCTAHFFKFKLRESFDYFMRIVKSAYDSTLQHITTKVKEGNWTPEQADHVIAQVSLMQRPDGYATLIILSPNIEKVFLANLENLLNNEQN